MKPSKTPGQQPRRRPGKNTYTTKSGSTIKLHRSLSERFKASRDAKARRRAAYLSTLPKNRFKRVLFRLHPKQLWRYWFSRDGAIMALKITGVCIVVFFVLIVGLFAYFRKDLPDITNIADTKIGGSITYFDRTGQTVLWQDYDAVKRTPVAGDKINDNIKQATVAIEDKDFYKHGAFDVRGIVRAGLHDALSSGGGVQGGSTISQQLVKLNQNWTADRSITRKVKEVILAVELEREYSKQDILNGYLNVAPYGPVEYGVETAAQDYFGVSAKDLTLAQASMLAAIPKSPNTYSPYGPAFDPQALLGRQHYILDQMVSQKIITRQQADAAKRVDVLSIVKPQPNSLYAGIQAPYFVLTAKRSVEATYGGETYKRGGWKVITTLDLNLQHSAEQIVQSNVPNITRLTGGAADEEATVAEDVTTGQIVALVGGTDFSNAGHGQNNYASGVLIPPGSSFKPYDYTTFIENNNAGAGSVLYDSQGPLPGYPCTNKNRPKNDPAANCLWDYDFIYPGPLTLRYALGGSRNVPAVKAMLSAVPNDTSAGRVASINKVIGTATAMMDNPTVKGNTYNCYSDEALTQTTQCYGASAIGDGAFLHLDDHVNGLGTLARLGVAIPKTYILKITDSSNKLIYQWKQPPGKQVIRPDTAYVVNDMASDPNASYLPGSYKFQRDHGWHFAVKTGTTNNGFDGLMTSWSTRYAVVSWVGNNMRNKDLTAAHGASMEQLTEPLTRGLMEAAHANLKPVDWIKPSTVKNLPAFVVRNHIHYGDVEPSPNPDLFPGWYTPAKGSNQSETIDTVSNKIATSCTPDLAKKNTGGGSVNAFSVDVFMNGSLTNGGGGDTSTASDDVHNCNDAKPSVTLSAPDSCHDASDCAFTVVVTAGTHPLDSDQFPGTVNLLINGQVAQTKNVTDSPSNVFFTYTPTAAGPFTVEAQVIDSVLYSASSGQQTVTAVTGGSPH